MAAPDAGRGHEPPVWQLWAAGTWPVDRILRRRARDIVAKTGIARELAGLPLLLDIGAGTGHLGEALVERCPGLARVAVDPCWRPTRRVEARLAAGGRHAYLCADALALPLASGSCPAALIGFVLHHLEPDAQVRLLGEAARVLAPGGRLILLEDTPATEREAARTVRADRRLNLEPPSSPHHYRSVPEWRRLLSELGLTIAREAAFSRVFPPATIGAIPHHAFVSATL